MVTVLTLFRRDTAAFDHEYHVLGTSAFVHRISVENRLNMTVIGEQR